MGYNRKAENHIIYYRKKRNWKLRNLIILSYISILGLAMYNTSYLTFIYILLIQFIFLIDSLNFENKTVKSIFKYIIYFVMLCLYFQILCINFFNIPKFQKELLFEKEIIDQDGNIKYYSKWTKLGINYTFHPSQYYMMEEWISYLFIVFSFVIFFYISNIIKKPYDKSKLFDSKTQSLFDTNATTTPTAHAIRFAINSRVIFFPLEPWNTA